MKLIKIILVICSGSLLLLTTSCGIFVKSLAKSQITVERKAIPPDFGKDNTVLLCIIKGKKSYDKYMKKHVINEYHGKYEFVLKKDLYDDKYDDTSKYRYLLDLNKIEYSNYAYSGRDEWRTNYVTTAAYYILDREENLTYESPMTSSFFAKIIQAYMINLEKERLKHR